MSEAQKNFIDLLDNLGVCSSKIASILITQVGIVENLNLIEQDIQNYLSTKRQKNLEKRDVQLMLNNLQSANLKVWDSFMQYRWM